MMLPMMVVLVPMMLSTRSPLTERSVRVQALDELCSTSFVVGKDVFRTTLDVGVERDGIDDNVRHSFRLQVVVVVRVQDKKICFLTMVYIPFLHA